MLWSMVLFAHSSWVDTSPAMRAQLAGLGLPCPPDGPTVVAVPVAVVDSAPADPIGVEEVAAEGEADEAVADTHLTLPTKGIV